MGIYLSVCCVMKGSLVFRKKGSNGIKLLSMFFPFLLYVFIQMIFNCYFANTSTARAAYIYNFSHLMISLMYIVVSYCFLISVTRRHPEVDITKCLVFAAGMQVFFIFISVISDSIHMRFLNMFLHNTANTINHEITYSNRWRAYGLSGYYFDNLSYILSGICLVSIVKGICTKKTSFLIMGVFILLASMLGARTSIILTFVGIIIASLYYAKREKAINIIKWIFFVVLALAVIYLFLNSLSEGFRDWIKTGWSAVFSVFSNTGKESAFSEILEADIVFPKNLVFGLGAKPESLQHYDIHGHFIDNGFIQLLWRFGILGSILFLVGLVRFYTFIGQKSGDWFTKGLCVIFLFISLSYLLKYYPLSTYGAHIVYYVIPAILYCSLKEKRERNKYI